MNSNKHEFTKNDKNGNYDVDGVSYDGKEIHVASDNTTTDEPKKKFPQKTERKDDLKFPKKKNKKTKKET